MRLQDIMETAVDTVPDTMDAERAWSAMRRGGFHHLVVTRGREVVGIVSSEDLGGARGAAFRRNRTVSELMTGRVVTAGPDTTVRKAANLLRGRSIGCLPVMKRDTLVGIVTTTDLLELLGRGAERPAIVRPRATLATRGPRRKRSVS